MNDLIKLLQKADREEDAQDKIDKLLNVDCLVIDEALDPDKVTLFKSNWQLPFLDTFIRNRINKHKGIIFISNVKLDDVNEEKFEKSIKDLIKREVAAQKAELLFEDNYIENKSKVDVESLF
jgi:DNA replication protein DnaC